LTLSSLKIFIGKDLPKKVTAEDIQRMLSETVWCDFYRRVDEKIYELSEEYRIARARSYAWVYSPNAPVFYGAA